jgi:hypothetical protein
MKKVYVKLIEIIDVKIEQKQLDNAEYFNYFGSIITNVGKCTE